MVQPCSLSLLILKNRRSCLKWNHLCPTQSQHDKLPLLLLTCQQILYIFRKSVFSQPLKKHIYIYNQVSNQWLLHFYCVFQKRQAGFSGPFAINNTFIMPKTVMPAHPFCMSAGGSLALHSPCAWDQVGFRNPCAVEVPITSLFRTFWT